MPEPSDDKVVIAVPDRGWTIPGGHDDDDATVLYVCTAAGQFEVRVPLTVDNAGVIQTGLPEVTAA